MKLNNRIKQTRSAVLPKLSSPPPEMSEPAPAPAAAAPTATAASSSEDDAAATAPSGQQQQELHAATSEMLAKMSKYVEGEAELSTEDYRLLQAMNITAADKYSEMAGYAAGLVAFAEQLDGKYRELAPQLAQIDAMESQVGLTLTLTLTLYGDDLHPHLHPDPSPHPDLSPFTLTMESQVGELEGAVAQLDAYSRRLEAKFQSLDGPG